MNLYLENQKPWTKWHFNIWSLETDRKLYMSYPWERNFKWMEWSAVKLALFHLKTIIARKFLLLKGFEFWTLSSQNEWFTIFDRLDLQREIWKQNINLFFPIPISLIGKRGTFGVSLKLGLFLLFKTNWNLLKSNWASQLVYGSELYHAKI